MALNEDDGPGPCQPQSGSGSLKSGARVGGDTVTVPSTADMSTQSAMLALPLLSCEQAGALDGWPRECWGRASVLGGQDLRGLSQP